MSATDDHTRPRPARLSERLRSGRLALTAAALVFAALWAAGMLALTPALTAFALIAAAILLTADRTAAPVRQPPTDERPLGTDIPQLEAVLAGIPDPVVALDRRGEVVALNARAGTVAPGLRRGEQVSLGLRAPEVLEAIRQAVAGEAIQRVEFFERVPVVRWYEAVLMPIELASDRGAPSARLVLMTFHDLTPLRRVEEMRADFIANASHELRTPLAALSGFIETLQGPAREDPHARTRFLAIMQAQATRMARLINDLLSLSRIELNAHLRPDKEIDLVSIIRQVVDGLQTLARDRDVAVSVTVPPEPLTVLGDRDELLRVVENLMENALKYAASGKRVEISLATAEGTRREACIRVHDYGPGIAPEYLPRLTERFYRVDVADSRAQGGTGLGLALVKHILNRHGGRLTIESVLGEGATFAAYLPLSES
jgi:two-component system phosphate regulon sensor histidine kinase PhoR